MRRTDQRVPPPRPGEPGNVCNYYMYHDNRTSEQIHNAFHVHGIVHKQTNKPDVRDKYETDTPIKGTTCLLYLFYEFRAINSLVC